MDVILLERIEKLGNLGDVVKVKAGYARNYLLPEKKALRATEANKKYFETQKAHIEEANREKRAAAGDVAGALEGQAFTLLRQAGESGQLYGSVSARDIAQAIKERGIAIERKHVMLDHPIKAVGLFEARIMPHPEVEVTVRVTVARSEEEAEVLTKRGVIGPALGDTEQRRSAREIVEEIVAAEEASERAEGEAAAATEAEETPAA
ncbi:MAG: 50S ribosomal protein L9 [Candidatus Eiseniibacteriota bacterium]